MCLTHISRSHPKEMKVSIKNMSIIAIDHWDACHQEVDTQWDACTVESNSVSTGAAHIMAAHNELQYSQSTGLRLPTRESSIGFLVDQLLELTDLATMRRAMGLCSGMSVQLVLLFICCHLIFP